MSDSLYTPTDDGEGFVKDRGSKFWGFAYPATEQAEVNTRLSMLKKTYHDARHYCYAFRLGLYGETVFATDDGEPAHSAGDPILGAIRSLSVTNVVVVVVRYFGGTKLGVRGLIEAYRTAAEMALAATPRQEIIPKVVFLLRFAYDQTSEVNRLFHPHVIEEVSATYEASVTQTLAIRKADFPALEAQLIAANLDWELLSSD
jgi:putative IMPACT (imprinted ancient) family translation regulator